MAEFGETTEEDTERQMMYEGGKPKRRPGDNVS
jgi:hypothetical protein